MHAGWRQLGVLRFNKNSVNVNNLGIRIFRFPHLNSVFVSIKYNVQQGGVVITHISVIPLHRRVYEWSRSVYSGVWNRLQDKTTALCSGTAWTNLFRYDSTLSGDFMTSQVGHKKVAMATLVSNQQGAEMCILWSNISKMQRLINFKIGTYLQDVVQVTRPNFCESRS